MHVLHVLTGGRHLFAAVAQERADRVPPRLEMEKAFARQDSGANA